MTFLTTLFFEYGLWAMFLLILIEYACFPISSEIVLPLAGAVAAAGEFPFLLLLPISVVAGLLGTSFCYMVGYFGGPPLLDKLSSRFPSWEKGLCTSRGLFDKYGSLTVGFGRVIPICRTYIAFIAGALRQTYAGFLTASFVGIAVWNTLLMGLGYYLGNNWSLVASWYREYKLVILAVLLLLILFLVWRSRRKKAGKHTPTPPSSHS